MDAATNSAVVASLLDQIDALKMPSAHAPLNLKLTYFELPGRAEMSRLVLIYAGIKFEDNRVSGGDWQTMKSDVKPWHQLPILEADGRTISQSNAILRYVGRIAGLIPADPFDEAKVNELVDGLEEVIAVFIPTFGISDADAKIKARQDICADGGKLEKVLTKFEAFLEMNGGASGFAVGNSITIADFALFNQECMLLSGWLDGVPTTALDKFPKLQAHRQKIGKLPKIGKYYEDETDSIRAQGWKV